MTQPGQAVWITRAQPGAARTADRVRALGFPPLIAPLLAVQTLSPPIDLEGVGALAFSSANGVAAFAALSPERDLSVFAVGDATAQAARDAGFATVVSASGDVEDLERAIADAQPSGAVLWAGAETPAGDLLAGLARRGVPARGVAVYRTIEVAAPAAVEALSRGDVAHVLIHSPRAGQALAQALADRTDPASAIALCLSPAVAAAIQGRAWCEVRIAERPDEDALLALLGKPHAPV